MRVGVGFCIQNGSPGSLRGVLDVTCGRHDQRWTWADEGATPFKKPKQLVHDPTRKLAGGGDAVRQLRNQLSPVHANANDWINSKGQPVGSPCSAVLRFAVGVSEHPSERHPLCGTHTDYLSKDQERRKGTSLLQSNRP